MPLNQKPIKFNRFRFFNLYDQSNFITYLMSRLSLWRSSGDAISGGEMVSMEDEQIFTSELESHFD